MGPCIRGQGALPHSIGFDRQLLNRWAKKKSPNWTEFTLWIIRKLNFISYFFPRHVLLNTFSFIYINLIWKRINIVNAMGNNLSLNVSDSWMGCMVTHNSPVFCNFRIIFVLFHSLLYHTDSSEVEQTFLECSRSRDNTGESDTAELTVRRHFCLPVFVQFKCCPSSGLIWSWVVTLGPSVYSLSRPRLIASSSPPKTVAANMISPSVFMAEYKWFGCGRQPSRGCGAFQARSWEDVRVLVGAGL